MKAFITGGTGFIGSRIVAQLVERGDEVRALVRSGRAASKIRKLGATPVWGEICDLDSMRSGMQGCDTVFHVAGWYKLGNRDWHEAETVNVEGTRNVLSLAHALGIPRIIFTSTVAVFGDTHGAISDEMSPMPDGPFLTEYDRTKWMAHCRVALPLIQKGAPIIIVMPGAVYGPGDPSLVGQMMRLFQRGWLPVLPGPELTLAWAHVDDIAAGHILAAEKGRIGQSYILTGPVISMGDMVQIWSQVSGTRPPQLTIPARYIKPLAPVMDGLASLLPIPELLSRDSIAILEASYTATSEKAQRELGWQLRPLEEGLRQTFEQETSEPQTGPSLSPESSRLALAAVLGAALFWLLTRRRKN